MLFGQMPVLFVDGEQIAHSRASLRYLAREFNLDGGNSLNAGKADMWIEVLFESFSKLAFSDPDESKRVSLRIAPYRQIRVRVLPRMNELSRMLSSKKVAEFFDETFNISKIPV